MGGRQTKSPITHGSAVVVTASPPNRCTSNHTSIYQSSDIYYAYAAVTTRKLTAFGSKRRTLSYEQ